LTSCTSTFPGLPDDLDPYRLDAQTQVICVIAMVAAKVGDEASSERARRRLLRELTRREFGAGG
jgi:hypothetical protein